MTALRLIIIKLGPSLFDIVTFLGKKYALNRLQENITF